MATKQEIIEYLEKYVNDTDKIFIGYNDYDECECRIYSATDIIDLANEVGDFSSEDEDSIIDVDDALSYLADMDEDMHFVEITL